MGSCGLVPLAPHLLRRSLSSRGRRCREADPHPSGSPIVGQVSALPQATPSFPHHIFMTLSSRPSLLQPCRQSLMPASETLSRAAQHGLQPSQPPSQWLIEAASLPGRLRLWAEPPEASLKLAGFRVTHPTPRTGNCWSPSLWWTCDSSRGLYSNTDLEIQRPGFGWGGGWSSRTQRPVRRLSRWGALRVMMVSLEVLLRIW